MMYINHFKSNIWQNNRNIAKVLLLVDNFKNDIFLEKEQDSYFKLMILPLYLIYFQLFDR